MIPNVIVNFDFIRLLTPQYEPPAADFYACRGLCFLPVAMVRSSDGVLTRANTRILVTNELHPKGI